MPVTYQLTEGENWKRTLKIEVALEQVQGKFETIYKKFKAEVIVPGFRPGKAPMSTIRSRYSETALHDALEELLDESYAEVMGLADLEPITRPTITDIEFAEDKPLVYTAELEVRPVITLERYTGFTLKRPDDRVKDGEVTEMLEHLQRKHSSLESVDRPAAEKDFVIADLEVLSDSAGSLKEKQYTAVTLELIDGVVAGQFLKQLLGVKTDDVLEIEVVYPHDHYDKRFAGSTVRFRARITAVKQLNLIELNEEFFHVFNEKISTLEEFREDLRGGLQNRKSKESNDDLREEVMKEVIDKNRFDLPESLLERYLDNVVEDFRHRYKEKFDEAEVRDHYRAIGIRHIRWDLLMNEVAVKENLKVEQVDIESWIQRFADNNRMSLEEAKKWVTDNRKVADLKETILENKVIEFITANSTIEAIYSPLVKPEE